MSESLLILQVTSAFLLNCVMIGLLLKSSKNFLDTFSDYDQFHLYNASASVWNNDERTNSCAYSIV